MCSSQYAALPVFVRQGAFRCTLTVALLYGKGSTQYHVGGCHAEAMASCFM